MYIQRSMRRMIIMALATVGRASIPIPGQAFFDHSSMNAMRMPEGSRISRLRAAIERLSLAWRARWLLMEKKGMMPSRNQSSKPQIMVVPYESTVRSGMEKKF